MKVRCNHCYWIGDEEDLPLEWDKENEEWFHACPNCKTDEYLMDLDEEG